MEMTKDIHMKLDMELFEKLQGEARSKRIPASSMARLCLVERYGGDSVPQDSMINGEDPRILRDEGA